MNGYYILAIVFIAVAAGLVVTYHAIRFKLEMAAEKRKWGDGKAAAASRLRNFTERCWVFVLGISISLALFGCFLGLGIEFTERAERELTEYQARYKTAISLTDGDFYKYSGNQLAKETIDIAEWVAKVNWSVDRYGRFSPYYSLKGRVRLTIGGAEQW